MLAYKAIDQIKDATNEALSFLRIDQISNVRINLSVPEKIAALATTALAVLPKMSAYAQMDINNINNPSNPNSPLNVMNPANPTSLFNPINHLNSTNISVQDPCCNPIGFLICAGIVAGGFVAIVGIAEWRHKKNQREV